MKQITTVLKFLIPLALGFYLLWHFYTAMDEPTKEVFFRGIREANYFWISLSLILGWFSHLARAYRWKYLLEPLGLRPSFWHRYHALMVGYLINLAIPRAGEATRAALLYRTDKIPFSKSFGTIIGERVFDLVMLGLILLLAFSLNFEDILSIRDLIRPQEDGNSGGINWLFWILLLIGFGFFIFLVAYFKVKKFRTKINIFIREIMSGVFSIFKTKDPFGFIFFTLLIWFLYILYFGICFYAFDATKTFSFGGILIGFIAGTFGVMFTNGGIGAYPYLVGLVVAFYIGDQMESQEMATGIGKALGMIIWSTQTIGMIILGFISFILLPRNFEKEKSNGALEKNIE